MVHLHEWIPAYSPPPARKTAEPRRWSQQTSLMHQCQVDPSLAEVVMLLDELTESPVYADDGGKYSAKAGVLSRVLKWVWRGWPKCTLSPQFT